jgi:hypothetical protein
MFAYKQADLKVKKALLGQLIRLGDILTVAISSSLFPSLILKAYRNLSITFVPLRVT